MSKEPKPRSLTLFEESCRSGRTKETYKFHLDKFLSWSNKDYESLLFLEKKELTDLLIDYVIYLKKRLNENSIPSPFSAIFKYLDINEREYNKTKVRSIFPQKVKAGGERAITDSELRDLIRVAPTKKSLALINVLASTGARPEALCQLKMKDIGEMPNGCMSLVVYAGSLNEYITFLHQEAVAVLSSYFRQREKNGERLTSNSFIFVPDRFHHRLRNKPLNPTTIAKIVSVAMKKAETKRVKTTENRFDLAVCTGIRKRFNTKLKKNSQISYAIAENFMDHKTNLEGHYLKPTKDELFEEYKKAIPDLIIDESLKLKEELKKKDDLIKDQKSQKDSILKDYGERLSDAEKIIKHLQKKIDTS